MATRKHTFIIPTTWPLIAIMGISFAAFTVGAHYLGHERYLNAVSNQIKWHQSVIEGKAPAPDQYRLLTYLMAEGLIQLGVGFVPSYLGLRFIFDASTFIIFFLFMRRWLSSSAALIGCLALAMAWPITIRFDFMQPTDPLGLLTFVIGVWSIRDRKRLTLLLTMVVAGLNREVVVVLVTVVFVATRLGRDNWKCVLLESLAIMAFGLTSQVMIRTALGKHGAFSGYVGWWWGGSSFLEGISNAWLTNLRNPASFSQMIYMFNLIPALALYRWHDKPVFLKRATFGLVPTLVGLTGSFAFIWEGRQMLPSLIILIPLAMASLDSRKDGPANQGGG